MIKLVFFLLLSVVTAVCSFGQMVSNVDAYQEGKNIIITYDTDKAGSVGDVYCSTDGGRTWGEALRQVTGDVNKLVPAGRHRIVWDVLSEREKLSGANICFKVVANSGRFTVRGVSFEMVRVEGGTFRMGATSEQGSDVWDNEKPVHSVTLSGYYIGKTEVTQALWKAVMGINPSRFKGDYLPVENVSWDDCQEFIRKLNSMTGQNFRLPTEAEWEFACRGGNNSRGYKYSGSNNLGSVAWYDGNSGNKTHPVGTKAPNELGIYEMCGSGAPTGMEITAVVHRPILQVPTVGRAVWAVAVVGTSTSGSVARRFVSTPTRRTATSTLACGWPFEFATKLPLFSRNSFCLT